MANIFQRAASVVKKGASQLAQAVSGIGRNLTANISGAFQPPPSAGPPRPVLPPTPFGGAGPGGTQPAILPRPQPSPTPSAPAGPAPFLEPNLPLSLQPAFGGGQQLTPQQRTEEVNKFIAGGGSPITTSLPQPGNIGPFKITRGPQQQQPGIFEGGQFKPIAGKPGEEGESRFLGGGGFFSSQETQGVQGASGGAQLLPGATAPLFRTGGIGTGIPTDPEEEKRRSEKIGGPNVSIFPGTTPDPSKALIAGEFAKTPAAAGLKEIQVAPKALRFIPQKGQEFIVDVPDQVSLETFQQAVQKTPLRAPLNTADTVSGFQNLISTAVQNEKARLDQIDPPDVPSYIEDPDVNKKAQETGDTGLLARYTQIQDALGITSTISQIKDLTNHQLAIKNAIVTARDEILEDPDFPKDLKAKRVNYLLQSSKEAREFEAMTDRINALTSHLKSLNDEAKTRIGLVETEFRAQQDIAKETRTTKREDEKAIRELQIKYPEAAIGPTDTIGTATQKASQAEQVKSKGKFEIREADGNLIKVYTNDPTRQAEVIFRGTKKATKPEVDELDKPIPILDLQRATELFPELAGQLTPGMTQRQLQNLIVSARSPRDFSSTEAQAMAENMKTQGLTREEALQEVNIDPKIKNKDEVKAIIEEKYQRKGLFGIGGGSKTKPPSGPQRGGPQGGSFDPFRSGGGESSSDLLVSFPSTFRF